eukprot:evm.model.scf_56EXC.7 EVM.evm.TU.scf_56EXC.7   scf_56EXC:87979-91106(-)
MAPSHRFSKRWNHFDMTISLAPSQVRRSADSCLFILHHFTTKKTSAEQLKCICHSANGSYHDTLDGGWPCGCSVLSVRRLRHLHLTSAFKQSFIVDDRAHEMARSSQNFEGEMSALRAENESLGAELDNARQQINSLTRLQLELQARQPDLEKAVKAAVYQEQLSQDLRNQKALDLLQNKDAIISRLEKSHAQLLTENKQVQGLLTKASEEAARNASLLEESFRAREKIELQMQREHAEAAAKQASLKTEIAALSGEVAAVQSQRSDLEAAIRAADEAQARASRLEAELEHQFQALNAATEEAGRLSSKLSEARSRIEELEESSIAQGKEYGTHSEDMAKAHDSDVQRLQQQVADLEDSLAQQRHNSSSAPRPISKARRSADSLNISLAAG